MDAEEVFEILVREHSEMLLRFLRASVADRSAVDDLFQETFMVAWRRLDDFDRSRPFAPWLRGIAGNVVLTYYRRVKRAPMLVDSESVEYLQQAFDGFDRTAGDTYQEKLDTIEDCLARMPEIYRIPVSLRYRDECGLESIAKKLSLATEAVKKRLQRGKAKLLDCLKRKQQATV